MSKNQISIFSTRTDLLELLSDIASVTPFLISHLDTDGIVVVGNSANDFDDLGVMTVGDQNQGNTYLLVDPGKQPTTRSTEQRNGKVKVIYDQKSYPKSVMMRSGGLLVGSNCVIAGQVGTVSEDIWSIALYKTIHSLTRKRFTKIRSFYVGHEAATMLDDGYRLTTNIKAPFEYDLNRQNVLPPALSLIDWVKNKEIEKRVKSGEILFPLDTGAQIRAVAELFRDNIAGQLDAGNSEKARRFQMSLKETVYRLPRFEAVTRDTRQQLRIIIDGAFDS